MTKPNQSSVKYKIMQNMDILRTSTGLNYQVDISGIPTGYKLVLTDLTTSGEWDISSRMKPREFLEYLYNLINFLYHDTNKKDDKRFKLEVPNENV